MKKDLLPGLRRELENIFGRKVLSSRDCLQLVEDIYQKTGDSINANTLRRFFGLVHTDYKPSPSTLIILLKYCGFNSLEDLEHVSVTQRQTGTVNEEEVLHFLIAFYKTFPNIEFQTDWAEAVVEQTLLFLEKHPNLIDRFQREIIKVIPAAHVYFELSINMDQLNSFYGEGLSYYVRAKNTDEARLFVHSMFVFKYWLSKNDVELDKQVALMSGMTLFQYYPPHIIGRVISARLFHAHVHQLAIDKILTDAARYQAVLHQKHAVNSFPHFELAVCEALTLTGHPVEAEEYLKKGKSHIGRKAALARNHFAIWDLIIQDKNRKSDLSPKPKTPIQQNFLNRRYTSLVNLYYKSGVRKEQLKPLVRETGFTRFGDI